MILVTGGAGFIGSHTCKALRGAGFEPLVYDNLTTGFRHNVKWGPLVIGDTGDANALRRAFHEYPIEGVLHFAASAYVGESVTAPLRYWRNNAANTLTLLEVLVDFGCPPLVFSSSCATYGLPQANPIPVSHAQSPINPYGWTKFTCERLILDACHAPGLRAGILRYFNAAGADPDGELLEEHDPETHLIPLTIDAALGTAPPLKVFGDDYPTSDGTCIRDYIHVTDLANAHVRALKELGTGCGTFIRNLGTGKGHSVKEVIETVAQVTGRKVPFEMCPRREGDPPALVAHPDPGTVESLKYPNLPEIVETAARYRKRSSARRPRVSRAMTSSRKLGLIKKPA
jgi:UDP-arabinose 4-epimerase